MKARSASVKRKTGETDISVSLTIDGRGKYNIDTPVGFLDHMLEQFAAHGLFDLTVKATGDMRFDEHHVVEDVGIVLGQAFAKAIGDKSGINRYGFFVLPMDDVLTTAAFDFAGRYGFRFDADFKREKIGELSTELIRHFWDAFAQNSRANLFIRSEYGSNDHHRAEGMFKAVARSVRMACEPDPRAGSGPPSTKGRL